MKLMTIINVFNLHGSLISHEILAYFSIGSRVHPDAAEVAEPEQTRMILTAILYTCLRQSEQGMVTMP